MTDNPQRRITVYTDGACTGNPGPAGIGIVLSNGKVRRLISEYLGHATNNIAELTAIKRALEVIKSRELPIDLYTDSSYSIGVLTQGWKAKANQELIAEIKIQLLAYPRLKIHKVEGHAGVPGNEKADELARKAVESQSSSSEYENLN